MSMNKKISLTSKMIEEELKRENYKLKYIKLLKSTFSTLIVIVAISIIISTFVVSVLEVSGSSMSPTLNQGQTIIAFKSKNIKKNDIIAFYQGNKILVKRVVALEGDFVNIDDDGTVYINGNIIDEAYIDNKSLGNSNINYPYQVPSNHYFVLGDKRDTSLDSRNTEVGAVSKKDVFGKVTLRIWPLNKMGIIK